MLVGWGMVNRVSKALLVIIGKVLIDSKVHLCSIATDVVVEVNNKFNVEVHKLQVNLKREGVGGKERYKGCVCIIIRTVECSLVCSCVLLCC